MAAQDSLSLLPKDTLNDWIKDPVLGFAQWIGPVGAKLRFHDI